MVREWDSGSSLRFGRDCWWGEWMSSALSTFNTTTEVPLSKTLNPQLLSGCRSINGCTLLRVCVHGVCVCVCVCVHFGWVNCRAQIPNIGYHTWPYVTSLSKRENLNHPLLLIMFNKLVIIVITIINVLYYIVIIINIYTHIIIFLKIQYISVFYVFRE